MKSKYTLNQDYFQNIDNQEKAYFLGFMFADGCVSKRNNHCLITLQKQDKYILEKFRELLETDRPLMKLRTRNSWRLNFSSPKIKNDLIKQGCMPCKTFKLEFPDWLREDLERHFIRGFMDGDGSVSISIIRKEYGRLIVRITGREKFLKSILGLSKIEGIVRKIKAQRVYRLTYNCSSAISFLNWLYNDATIYLERKYQKFLDYLKWRREYEEGCKMKTNNYRLKMETDKIDFQYLGI